MRYLGYCNCGRLARLTRHKADGSKDICPKCFADEEYERLTASTYRENVSKKAGNISMDCKECEAYKPVELEDGLVEYQCMVRNCIKEEGE